jgi:hypothetical protein
MARNSSCSCVVLGASIGLAIRAARRGCAKMPARVSSSQRQDNANEWNSKNASPGRRRRRRRVLAFVNNAWISPDPKTRGKDTRASVNAVMHRRILGRTAKRGTNKSQRESDDRSRKRAKSRKPAFSSISAFDVSSLYRTKIGTDRSDE